MKSCAGEGKVLNGVCIPLSNPLPRQNKPVKSIFDSRGRGGVGGADNLINKVAFGMLSHEIYNRYVVL